MTTAARCEICGRGPADGEPVFRTNPTETPPIYRCDKHRSFPPGYPATRPEPDEE